MSDRSKSGIFGHCGLPQYFGEVPTVGGDEDLAGRKWCSCNQSA